MDARTAIRRGLARAISQPGFDPAGIPGFEALAAGLAPYTPEALERQAAGARQTVKGATAHRSAHT